MPVLFGIQDSGVLDVHDRAVAELLAGKIDLQRRVDVILVEPHIRPVNRRFVDAHCTQ